MTAPRREFPESEYRARTKAAQRLMAELEPEAVPNTTESEFPYFTGFLSQCWLSPSRPWFRILPAAGKP